MTTKHVHRKIDDISPDGSRDSIDLILCAVFETSLHEKVAESVDHEGVTLTDDGVDDFVFLGGGCEFEFLLEEEGGLLVALDNDFFNDSLDCLARKGVEMGQTFQLQDMDRSSKRRQSCSGSGRGYLGTLAEEPMKVYLSILTKRIEYIWPSLLVIVDNPK